MKKLLTAIVATLLVVGLLLPVTALAAGAPSWKSFFTSEKYNKTFTDKDGVHHEYQCYQVVEGWNKIGTVIYHVFYKDTTTRQISETEIKIDNIHKSAFFTYKNACPVFPNAPKYTYYYVNHYRDRDEVIDDYRADLPKTTPTPKATATPKTTAKPTAKPSAEATTKPSSKPTPTATVKATPKPTPTPVVSVAPATSAPMATTVPAPTATPTPMATAATTTAPTGSVPTASPSPEISGTATVAVTPEATATIQATTATVTPVTGATPTATDVPAAAPQAPQPPMKGLLLGSVVALLILGGVIYAVLRLRRTRSK